MYTKVYHLYEGMPQIRLHVPIIHKDKKTDRSGRTVMTNVNLSDGEWKIMNVLWEKESATITELTAVLQKETGWDKHIIITMLNRMLKKGAVSFQMTGRAKRFYPVVSRNEVSIRETKGLTPWWRIKR